MGCACTVSKGAVLYSYLVGRTLEFLGHASGREGQLMNGFNNAIELKFCILSFQLKMKHLKE